MNDATCRCPGGPASHKPGGGVHTEHEDHSWTVDIPDHPGRTESTGFRRAKTTAHKILAAARRDQSAALLVALADGGLR
jgi:hypothetical protein